MMYRNLFLATLALMAIAACSPESTSDSNTTLSLQWEIVASPAQGTDETHSMLTITNNTADTLGATGWSIYFNTGVARVADVDTTVAGIELVNGDFFRFYPRGEWQPLAPGATVAINVMSRRLRNFTDIPKGFYLVSDDHPAGVSLPLAVAPFAQADSLEMVLATQVYEQNADIADLPLAQLPPVLPTPLSYAYTADAFTLTAADVTINADTAFADEAAYLKDELAMVLTQTPKLVDEPVGASIVLHQREGIHPEGYRLLVDANGVAIEATTPAGAFYGIQSLKGLLPSSAWAEKKASITLQGVTITDGPRFAHRAVMLDVARNFQTKEQVMKVLDLLALHKVNVMHFHFSEDEAWRLEILGLPELTEVGARRGHTLDDAEWLMPSYGSGPDVASATGSGFYSRADYIELLRYATKRHIRVIPEIETPGHARAAIKSMDARYRAFIAKGDTAAATQYLLRDLDDQSEYRSIQNWDDNIINVALPSSYAFLEKVVDELIAMHKEAGAPLQTIHFGGDEVPDGVWEKSPAVHQLMASAAGVAHVDDLWHHFFGRINDMLQSRGLYLSGWEEIGMKKAVVDGRRKMVVEPRFANENFHTDVWNNLGDNVDLAYRLANAGYQVVLTNVTNFYIDLAYNSSFYEPGQYWGGYVDVEKPFRFAPYDYYRSLATQASGEQLTDQGRANIVGLQAPLWSEIITSPKRMEYLLLPKLYGLAERAWAASPAWATEPDDGKADELYAADWSVFLNTVAKRELPRASHYAGGFAYRIPTAGVVEQSGKLHANVQLPGFAIRYTVDGSEPTEQSMRYTEPLAAEGTVAFRVFDGEGRGGRTVYWK
ncbi:family 20 glycosylhydrolase [Parapedobacter sp. 10938]|uniref:family 20 glycosylhydrolase n=1 Tax=Parapedobacter flavus TaxID=3110225 RepID=UPI002DB665AB|nr:family 20 glycosylhydrolase [Parapedobacter sp. 10938]MEC3879302.1 family 20 glycosylhydrolase [Parapedobacter sp. 10938]